MDGLFLLLAIGRAHQQEGLLPVRAGADLYLDAIAHLLPVLWVADLRKQPLQVVLLGANQIQPLTVLQPGNRVCRDHAAIHHPDASCAAVLALYLVDDLFHGGHVGAVAGKHFIAEWHAVAGDDKTDAYLLTVMAMITAIAALGERVSFSLAFKIGTGNVIEQKLVIELKQCSQALF